MKHFYILGLAIFATALQAQVTIRITAVPANTPENAIIYMAGSVNNWNPADPTFIMQPDGLGALVITIPEGTGVAEYKFTRGSWASVQGNANGGFQPNSAFTFTGSPQTINVTILSWEDISGSGGNSTAASNVQIMNSGFYIPQLDRYRRIWIYLPPDYFTSTKDYPVLYMEDGQNLFDDATSFSGEWHVDESLNTLMGLGDYGAIVIGIDNGGAYRLDEYSPWNNPSFGGGQGDLYMQFLSETLKPYVDANFRTRPEPQFNALIGSSMGAFISAYGGAKNPGQFGKLGLMSPAFWFSMTSLSNYITGATTDMSQLRMYFVAGQNESASMVPNISTIANNFDSNGVSASNIFIKIDSFGQHNEAYWSGEFSAMYQWLFQNENLAINNATTTAPVIFQNHLGDIFAEGIDRAVDYHVFTIQGQFIGKIRIANGINRLPETMASGIYLLKDGNSKNPTLKVIKR